MRTMNCPHCHRTVEVPPGFMQWAGRCECGRSVFDAVQDDDQGTTTNEKSPAPAATSNEGNENFGERSVTTAYLSYNPGNTGVTFGTWAGVDLPIKDHVTVILPFDTVQRMYAHGPQLVGISTACADAQSREVRKQREEQTRKERERRRNEIAEQLETEARAELLALEEQIDVIYSRINARADELLDQEANR